MSVQEEWHHGTKFYTHKHGSGNITGIYACIGTLCQPAQHGGHATDISSSDNELYLVIGAFTVHHVLPAAISYPSDHWPASDDPCRILSVIDQDLVSAAANNKIKQSVLSKQSTSCKRSYAPCEASSRLSLRQCTS